MRLKSLFASVLCSISLCSMPIYGKGIPGGGYVHTHAPEKAEENPQHVEGSLTLLSDYSYRGITESMNMPALQGELLLSEKPGEGFFVGFWGSTVDSVTAPHGNGLEGIVNGGYAYKFTPDFTGKVGLYYMFYPQCYEGLTRNQFDQFEFIPGFTYKWLTFYVAYTLSNVTGLTPDLIQELFVAPPRNGNTKRSLYTYGSLMIPLNKPESLNLKVWAGYWKIRHYSMLSYGHFGVGLYQKLPKNWSELILSVNVEGTTAKTRHWTNVISELDDKKIRLGGTKFWIGITKQF